MKQASRKRHVQSKERANIFGKIIRLEKRIVIGHVVLVIVVAVFMVINIYVLMDLIRKAKQAEHVGLIAIVIGILLRGGVRSFKRKGIYLAIASTLAALGQLRANVKNYDGNFYYPGMAIALAMFIKIETKMVSPVMNSLTAAVTILSGLVALFYGAAHPLFFVGVVIILMMLATSTHRTILLALSVATHSTILFFTISSVAFVLSLGSAEDPETPAGEMLFFLQYVLVGVNLVYLMHQLAMVLPLIPGTRNFSSETYRQSAHKTLQLHFSLFHKTAPTKRILFVWLLFTCGVWMVAIFYQLPSAFVFWILVELSFFYYNKFLVVRRPE